MDKIVLTIGYITRRIPQACKRQKTSGQSSFDHRPFNGPDITASIQSRSLVDSLNAISLSTILRPYAAKAGVESHGDRNLLSTNLSNIKEKERWMPQRSQRESMDEWAIYCRSSRPLAWRRRPT